MRKFLLYSAAFVWVAILFALIAPLVVFWPSLRWRNHLSLLAGRLWAKVALRLSGIEVRLEGVEHLQTRPAILTFNHTNVLDFFVNAFYADTKCLVFGKRELARLPFLGWGWFLGGHPMIKREDPLQWKVELGRTEEKLREGYSTIVAPEGKRSRDGTLLPFKKGAFHLAIATGLPIVPVVITGTHECLVKGEPRPGTIRVKGLQPIPTAGWSVETIDEHIRSVREVYMHELGVAQRAKATL